VNILAIGAHPDDIEILCGGTLAIYARAGHKVTMLTVANGDMGSTTLPPAQIAAIRRKESEASAAIIGAKFVCLDVPDVKVIPDLETRRKLTVEIRRARPDVILAHSPDDYMHDHRNASILALDASFDATIANIKTDADPMPFVPIYFMDTIGGIGFEPAEYVDISDHFHTKRRMLACHESQVAWIAAHDQADLLQTMEIMSRFRGLQAGVAFAEAFRPYAAWGRLRPRRLLP